MHFTYYLSLLFSSIRVYKNPHFYLLFCITIVFYLSAFILFSACSVFWIRYHLHRVFNYCLPWGPRCSVILSSLYKNYLQKQLPCYKNLILAHNKKYVSSEVLSFKIFIHKEKCGPFRKWKILKNVIKNQISWTYLYDFVEMTDLKYRTLSKHFLERL